MAKLKLGPISDEKPAKVALELPAALRRDLAAYADVLARETGQPVMDPVRLIVPMLERFMATDRGFAKARRPCKTICRSGTSRGINEASGVTTSVGSGGWSSHNARAAEEAT